MGDNLYLQLSVLAEDKDSAAATKKQIFLSNMSGEMLKVLVLVLVQLKSVLPDTTSQILGEFKMTADVVGCKEIKRIKVTHYPFIRP